MRQKRERDRLRQGERAGGRERLGEIVCEREKEIMRHRKRERE
jgi:hypothetical protein